MIIAWAKSNTVKFVAFVKQYILQNAVFLIVTMLKIFSQSFVESVKDSKISGKIQNILFGDSKIIKFINIFSSAGNIIATFLDVIDGKWDDKLMLKVR